MNECLTEPLAPGVTIGPGVPERLSRRVRAWGHDKRFLRCHVTVYMRRGGDAKLYVRYVDDEEAVVLLDEVMGVDEHPRDIARRVHALGAMARS